MNARFGSICDPRSSGWEGLSQTFAEGNPADIFSSFLKNKTDLLFSKLNTADQNMLILFFGMRYVVYFDQLLGACDQLLGAARTQKLVET